MEIKFGNLIIQMDTRLFRDRSIDQGIIYVSSGYDSPVLYAIRCPGSGEILPKVPSCMENEKGGSSEFFSSGGGMDLLFMAADNGVVSCLDAKQANFIGWKG